MRILPGPDEYRLSAILSGGLSIFYPRGRRVPPENCEHDKKAENVSHGNFPGLAKQLQSYLYRKPHSLRREANRVS